MITAKYFIILIAVLALIYVIYLFIKTGKKDETIALSAPDDETNPRPARIEPSTANLDDFFPHVESVGRSSMQASDQLPELELPEKIQAKDEDFGTNSEVDFLNKSGCSPIAAFRVNTYLLSRNDAVLYARLNNIFSEQFSVVPRVQIADIINANAEPRVKPDDSISLILETLKRSYFDYVLLDPHSARIKLVMLTNEQADSSGERDFMLSILRQWNLPVYLFDVIAVETLSDNDLAVHVAEVIDTTPNRG